MGPSAKSDRALLHFLPTVPSFKEGRWQQAHVVIDFVYSRIR